MSLIFLVLLLQASSLEADLQDESRETREAAIAELSARAPAEALALLEHESGRVRAGACEALVRGGRADSIPALLLCADDAAAAAVCHLARIHLLDLPSIAQLATPDTRARLRRAHADFVQRHFRAIRIAPRFSTGRRHRPLFSGGNWSAEVVRTILADTSGVEDQRAQALHALLLLEGGRARDVIVTSLKDAQPGVRLAAARALHELGTRPDYRALAALLEEEGEPNKRLLSYAIRGVSEMGKAGPRATEQLVESILGSDAWLASAASYALATFDRAQRDALLLRRLKDLQERGRTAEIAICLLHARPLGAEIRAFLKESKDPLVQAQCVSDKEAIKLLRTQLAPRRGPTEWIRISVLDRLLYRHGATTDDRLAFARPLLETDSKRWHETALRHLATIPEEDWADLKPRIRVAMQESHAGTSARAAALLLPEREATRTLWLALYDGAKGGTRIAVHALELPTNLPVAERRRLAREALAKIAEKKS